MILAGSVVSGSVRSGRPGRAVRSIVMLAPDIRIPVYDAVRRGPRARRGQGHDGVGQLSRDPRGRTLFRSRGHQCAAAAAVSHASRSAHSGQVRQIESTGRQTAHSLQVLGARPSGACVSRDRRIHVCAAHNDTSGINALPANNYDLASEWGRAPFDQRHRLEALLQLKAAMGELRPQHLAGVRPSYSLQTGRDDFHTGQTNARPAGVARNTLQGPGSAVIDLQWSQSSGPRALGEKGEGRPCRSRWSGDVFECTLI